MLVLWMGVIPRTAQGRWQWFSELVLTTRYDSNIQVISHGESDMVYLVGPQMGIKYQGPKVGITASYRANAELYATHHELNRVLQDMSLDTDLSRMMASILPKGSEVRVQEQIVYTPILPDFQSLVVPSQDLTTAGIRTPRTTTLRNVIDIEGSTPLSAVTRIGFAYKNIYTQYQDPSLIDSQMNEFKISYSDDLRRTDTLTTSYSYSQFNPFGYQITHLHTLTLRNRHDFSPILTGSAEAGLVVAVLPDLNRPQYSANGKLSISRRFKERVQLSARISRSVDNNSGISITPLITDRGSLSLDRQLTPALSAEAALNVARNYSIGAEKQTGASIDIHSQGASVGVHYQIASWLLSDLEYRYYRQETFGSFRADLTRNQYSFTLRAKWF